MLSLHGQFLCLDSIHIEFLKSDENSSLLLSYHMWKNETHLWVNTQSSCVNKKQHHVLVLKSSYSSHDNHLTVDFTLSSKYGFEICTQVTFTLSFFFLYQSNVHIGHLRNNNSPAFRIGLTHTLWLFFVCGNSEAMLCWCLCLLCCINDTHKRALAWNNAVFEYGWSCVHEPHQDPSLNPSLC